MPFPSDLLQVWSLELLEREIAVVDGCNSETFKDIISMMVFKQSPDVVVSLMDKTMVIQWLFFVSAWFPAVFS